MLDAHSTHSSAMARRQGSRAALCAMLGIVVSGPVAWLASSMLAPQPAWESAAVFAEHYQSIQLAPYVAGLVLVAGFVGLLASLHALAAPEHKAAANVALVFTAAFTALIVFNYMVQTTFVPALARNFMPAHALALSMWSMAHPQSLAWGIELWGYACLGVATWFAAPVLAERGSRGQSAALAFRLNGLVSVVTALSGVVFPGWVMTPSGLAAYTLWNVIAFAMLWLAFEALRKDQPAHPSGRRAFSESAA